MNASNGHDKVYGGVETGGTCCVCALGSSPGDLVAEEQSRTADPDATLAQVDAFFNNHSRPAAIGVGSFGPVDLKRDSPTWGYVTTTPKPGWRHVPVATVIQEQIGVPVVFDNDVDAAALGEHRWGAGKGSPSLCYLTVGTGIGASLLIHRRPWHPSRGRSHPDPARPRARPIRWKLPGAR